MLVLALAAAVACGGGPSLRSVPSHAGGVAIELIDTPTARFDAAHGATTVAARLVARGLDGQPLGPEDVEVTLLLDGEPLDGESVLQEGHEARAVNLVYSMVLDATYSMLLHEPPAFEPMKQAARRSVQAGTRLWQQRPGSFTWTVSWFDDCIYRPEGEWSDAALLSIPAPTRGAFTRLFAAVDHALEDLPAAGGDPAVAPHHVLVAFSDGQDNHSWKAMDPVAEAVGEAGPFRYRRLGWPATSLSALTDKLRARRDVTLHTIGMGAAVGDAELQALADAGRGRYIKNPGAGNIDALFAQVTREFTTLQTVGATLPNPPGDYLLTVVVRRRLGSAQGQLQLRLHAGDAAAQLRP